MCDHETYNKNCDHCKEINQCVGYAIKEGYTDFDDYDFTKQKVWEEMKDYYNWAQAHEGDTYD